MIDSDINGSPANPKILFHESVTDPDLRQLTRQSIDTLIARSVGSIKRARENDAALTKLTDAINAPIARLIQNDPQAVSALEELRKRSLSEADADTFYSDASSDVATGGITISNRGDLRPRAFAGRPPYDFSWSWHDLNGGGPFDMRMNPSSGYVGLIARSGSVDGGFSGFVNAHAGYGIHLRTDHPRTVSFGAQIESAHRAHNMMAHGASSSATSEGGIECTALENGRLIMSSSFKWWRKRISINETADDREGPIHIDVPKSDPRTFTMQPGRDYTFNIGLWVFSDRTPGIGVAGVNAVIEGNVALMWYS
jgi:hypothetical protein